MPKKLLVFVFCFAVVSSGAFGQSSAYREKIVTPHWVEHRAHAGGTVKALFLVNDLARREPDELGQRFDMEVSKVRTLRGSNAYKNVFDLDGFAKQLEASPDVLVISAAKPWKDLGPKGLEMTTDWVKAGGKLAIFTRSSADRELKDMSLGAGDMRSLTEEVSQGLDLESIFPGKFLDSFQVEQTSLGKGTITFTRPFDRAYVRFNAFFPKLGIWEDPEVVRETGYLLANRIIRAGAGKTSNEEGKVFQIQFRSASRQLLAEAKTEELTTDIPVQSTGELTVLWEKLNAEGQRIELGTTTVRNGDPEALEVEELSSPYPRNTPVTIQWTPISGKKDWQVEVEIYDVDRNRIRFASAPALAGKVTIPAWVTKQTSHEVRVLLIGRYKGAVAPKSYVRKGHKILAEHSQWLHLDADPDADQRQWTTLAWADERGNLADRWRVHRMRELGLNALATIGRNVEVNRLSAMSGLRNVPTNVLVPENRYNKGRFDEEQSKDWLAEFASGVKPLSPLGYSFADEPPKDVILPWLDKGADVLAKADPGARFGYCGVWPGPYSPEMMSKSGYLGLYSPGHLYNLNIWLGIERDIYRSFRREDGIVTIWTHYAPWADHEPYSRTVPWVWLLDGMDGVGYFKSTGMMFGILDGDLRSTDETRWWSEEIRELNRGIAEQVKRMKRDVGTVRILFGGNLKAVDPWARALNELSIPYQFLNAHQLEAEELEGVELLVAVDDGEVSEVVEEFVKAGGVLIGGGGLASSLVTSEDRFGKVFGFKPESMAADTTSDFAGIRSSVEIDGVVLEGLTTGECLPLGTKVGQGWKSLGGGKVPEHLAVIAESCGVRRGSEGRAVYLAFKPDVASVKRWLPKLLEQAGVKSPDIGIRNEDRVYVTRFSDGVAEMVGLVPDYIRIPPTEQIKEIEPNPRDSDDSVQKQQLGYFQHGPQRWEPVDIRLEFGGAKHVYDVREGKYLGQLQERAWKIQPGHPELLTLLPYKPPALKIDAPDNVELGTDLEFEVSLQSDAAKLARHVIRVELADKAGNAVLSVATNLHAEAGMATGRISIPHGLDTGAYVLRAHDVLTGSRSESTLTFRAPSEFASAPLSPWNFRVEHQRVQWPRGEWEPIPKGNTETEITPATARVKSLQRKAIRYGPFNGKEHLMSGFKIGNGLRSYEMKYLVCCDPKMFDRGPPQAVRGLNGSGLGMNRPRGHLWYYNSYLKIYLGDKDGEKVLGYELTRIEDLSNETTARVRLEWEAPSATARIDYVMIPGHEGLFQELTLVPRQGKPLTKTTVNLISYPAGFGKGTEPFFEVAQEHREWLLMGDTVRDRDFYESGKGSAGLLIRPEEWADVSYGSRPFLVAERPESEAQKPWKLHWTTWMFPERGNAAAKEYMRTHSESTGQQLLELFSHKE